MRLIAKELFIEHQERRPVVSGFATYVSSREPVLMHCYGWEDYSDGYDDYAFTLSYDNGGTWTEPVIHWKSYDTAEGKMRFAEPAALFDADTERLIVLTNRVLYPGDQLDVDADYSLVLDVFDLGAGGWQERREIAFPGERTPAMSFSFPIKTSRGRLLFPGMRQVVDGNGKVVHYPGCWAPIDEVVTVIGEYDERGDLNFHLGEPLRISPEVSSRGLDENALAELADGRIVAVCRGDNSMFPDRPGYKWLSFSSDQGETWSDPVPLGCDDGQLIESSASGSAFFRSLADQKLYWIGNLCIYGERPRGNCPRTSLVIAQVQEEPFALIRDSFWVVDEKRYNDSPEIQFSNFRFYQDRETAELVIFCNRYCEKGLEQWWNSDYYRYRVEVG